MSSRVAVVTGAAKPDSIGFAVAQGLLAEGCELVVADLYDAGFERFKGLCVKTDVADPISVQKMVDTVVKRFGRIDILVNCVGGSWAITREDLLASPPSGFRGLTKQLEDVDEDQWHKVLAANLTTAFLVCREFAPRMKARKFGSIVNFASIAARRGSDRVGVHYAAAKGGVIGLTKTLALELGPHGITVNAIAPGFIKTPRIEAADWGQVTPEFIDSLPLKRPGKPHDIAGVVAVLCSEAGGYVSGATIDVNGGWYFGP